MTRKAEPSGGGDLPRGWRWIALGEVCEINPRRPGEFVRGDEEETSFVPMEAVDARRGKVDRLRSRSYAEVKKGYTYFADGDVLFAKITPCMQNGKHFVAEGLIGGVGFASTEFHVLRHGDAIHAKWVHFYLTQPAILRKATYYFTGSAGQRRVPGSFLKGLKIPLPPIVEQAKILGILENEMGAVEKARRAALDRVEAARALDSAFLREALEFGDGELPPGWEWCTLGDLCEVKRGKSITRKEVTPGDIPVIAGGQQPAYYHNQANRTGEIITVSGSGAYAGFVNFFDRPIFASDCSTLQVKDGNVRMMYLYMAMKWRQQDIYDLRLGSAQPHVYPKDVSKIEIPLPPLSKQRQIIATLNAKMAAAKQARAAAEAELEAIEALPAALLRRAFRATP